MIIILSRIEHLIISRLYEFRTLSFEQLYEYIFKANDYTQSYASKCIKLLVSKELIEKKGFRKTDSYYFIKAKGLSYLRKNGYYSIGDCEERLHSVETNLKPSALKIKDTFLNHQLGLNEFVLQFRKKFFDTEFEYYDEKYMDLFMTNARADGIIKIGNILYFLEMDMNTERKQGLIKKWEHYRAFLNSTNETKDNFTIKVLFILGGGITESQKRSSDLREYIYANLPDKISPSFDVYIGTMQNLLQRITLDEDEQLINLLVSKTFTVNDAKDNGHFSFNHYIYLSDQNNQVVIENGNIQEYVVDDYRKMNMYVYKKVSEIANYQSFCMHNLGRNIKYLMVVDKEQDALNLVRETNCVSSGIYFTTLERINAAAQNELGIFAINKDGYIYNYNYDGSSNYAYKI